MAQRYGGLQAWQCFTTCSAHNVVIETAPRAPPRPPPPFPPRPPSLALLRPPATHSPVVLFVPTPVLALSYSSDSASFCNPPPLPQVISRNSVQIISDSFVELFQRAGSEQYLIFRFRKGDPGQWPARHTANPCRPLADPRQKLADPRQRCSKFSAVP